MARNGSKTAIYFVIFIAKQSLGLKAAVADLIHIPYKHWIFTNIQTKSSEYRRHFVAKLLCLITFCSDTFVCMHIFFSLSRHMSFTIPCPISLYHSSYYCSVTPKCVPQFGVISNRKRIKKRPTFHQRRQLFKPIRQGFIKQSILNFGTHEKLYSCMSLYRHSPFNTVFFYRGFLNKTVLFFYLTWFFHGQRTKKYFF